MKLVVVVVVERLLYRSNTNAKAQDCALANSYRCGLYSSSHQTHNHLRFLLQGTGQKLVSLLSLLLSI
jgi:hypothetical protein